MQASSAQKSEFRVYETQTLKKPKDMEADQLLKAIVAQVQPIMRKRQWRVMLLKEFFPSNANLLGLNVNRGEEICIRLRPSHDENSFLPYESLLGTMLHELVHNEHGPHDKNFYKLLDEITRECEELMAKGVTDKQDGFYGHGRVLGGRSVVSLGEVEASKLAGDRAAERQRRNGLSSAPQKLGGRTPSLGLGQVDYRNFSPIQMAAMAAERRYQDSLWCGVSLEDQLAIEEAIKGQVDRGAPTAGSHEERKRVLDPIDADSRGKGKQRRLLDDEAPPPKKWICQACTLENEFRWLQCDACGLERAS